MSKDNHQQSVGGQGAIDGLSGSEHPGTEGADSGQGVNKGAGTGSHGHDGQHSGGMGGEHGGDLHEKQDVKKNQPAP